MGRRLLGSNQAKVDGDSLTYTKNISKHCVLDAEADVWAEDLSLVTIGWVQVCIFLLRQK